MNAVILFSFFFYLTKFCRIGKQFCRSVRISRCNNIAQSKPTTADVSKFVYQHKRRRAPAQHGLLFQRTARSDNGGAVTTPTTGHVPTTLKAALILPPIVRLLYT